MESSTESYGPPCEIPFVQQTETSLVGRRRSAESLTRREYIFLFMSFLSVFTSLGFTIYRLATSPQASEDTVFSIVFIVNIVFCLLYIVDGIFREQYFEIIAVVLTTIIMLNYVILNYMSGGNQFDLVKLVRLCLSAVLGPPVVILGISLARHYSDKGFLIFRTVGGRADLQNACKLMRLAQTLLLFNAQALATLLILVLHGDTKELSNEEFWTLLAGGILTGLWLLLGSLALGFESRKATCIFLLLSWGQPAFVIWRFYEFSQLSVLYKCAITAGIIALIVHLALFVVTIFVQRNYGKGLRQQAYESVP